jgi:hypothetical protein
MSAPKPNKKTATTRQYVQFCKLILCNESVGREFPKITQRWECERP